MGDPFMRRSGICGVEYGSSQRRCSIPPVEMVRLCRIDGVTQATRRLLQRECWWYEWTVNTDQIRQRLRGGFRPFILHLSDGRTLTIPRPEFILVGKDIVAVLRENDLIETIDALHVVSAEDMKPNPPKTQ